VGDVGDNSNIGGNCEMQGDIRFKKNYIPDFMPKSRIGIFP
jgi:hypothetical protein